MMLLPYIYYLSMAGFSSVQTYFSVKQRRGMLPDSFTLKTAKTSAATSGNIHCCTRSYS